LDCFSLFRAEVRLQARVGVATGQVVVGDLISEGVSDKDAVSGDAPVTAPLAGTLQSAFAGDGPFGLFHEGGVVGERPLAVHYADAGIFDTTVQ
jgi:hypothetical protein